MYNPDKSNIHLTIFTMARKKNLDAHGNVIPPSKKQDKDISGKYPNIFKKDTDAYLERQKQKNR